MNADDHALLKEFFACARELAEATAHTHNWGVEADNVIRLADRIDLRNFLPADITRAP